MILVQQSLSVVRLRLKELWLLGNTARLSHRRRLLPHILRIRFAATRSTRSSVRSQQVLVAQVAQPSQESERQRHRQARSQHYQLAAALIDHQSAWKMKPQAHRSEFIIAHSLPLIVTLALAFTSSSSSQEAHPHSLCRLHQEAHPQSTLSHLRAFSLSLSLSLSLAGQKSSAQHIAPSMHTK